MVAKQRMAARREAGDRHLDLAAGCGGRRCHGYAVTNQLLPISGGSSRVVGVSEPGAASGLRCGGLREGNGNGVSCRRREGLGNSSGARCAGCPAEVASRPLGVARGGLGSGVLSFAVDVDLQHVCTAGTG